MANFFSILNSILKTDENYQSSYGELINESIKNDDRLKRGMTNQEIAYFAEIKKNNMTRILENCGNNIDNNVKIEKPIENMHISGIGIVSQVM